MNRAVKGVLATLLPSVSSTCTVVAAYSCLVKIMPVRGHAPPAPLLVEHDQHAQSLSGSPRGLLAEVEVRAHERLCAC